MIGNVLIIANAALNKSDSNGRNLAKLIDCIPFENRYEFYTYGNPDYSICENYYRMTDKDALNNLLGVKKNDQSSLNTLPTNSSSKGGNKTPFKMWVREIVWKLSLKRSSKLFKWVEECNPTCILVCAANNCFLLDLARTIAKKRNIPIFLYSTENYVFKDYNYVTKKKSFFYNLWFKKINKSYSKIEKYVNLGIFNSESLAKAYSEKYKYDCDYIYQNSDIDYIENSAINQKPIISYLGNLGLNRHKALIEIANSLSIIFPNATLDVYGNMTEEVKNDFSKYSNIVLKGFVSYEEVTRVIHNSTLLIHAEYNDPFYNKDLQYAFSTKITDSVCSGTPLLIYAPICLEETKFLIEKQCAFVACDKQELEKILKVSLTDIDARKRICNNALFVKENHFTNNGKLLRIMEAKINENITN